MLNYILNPYALKYALSYKIVKIFKSNNLLTYRLTDWITFMVWISNYFKQLNATYQLWATWLNQPLSSLKGEKSVFSLHALEFNIRINIWLINSPWNRWLFTSYDLMFSDKISFSFAFLKASFLLCLVLWLMCGGRLLAARWDIIYI